MQSVPIMSWLAPRRRSHLRREQEKMTSWQMYIFHIGDISLDGILWFLWSPSHIVMYCHFSSLEDAYADKANNPKGGSTTKRPGTATKVRYGAVRMSSPDPNILGPWILWYLSILAYREEQAVKMILPTLAHSETLWPLIQKKSMNERKPKHRCPRPGALSKIQ